MNHNHQNILFRENNIYFKNRELWDVTRTSDPWLLPGLVTARQGTGIKPSNISDCIKTSHMAGTQSGFHNTFGKPKHIHGSEKLTRERKKSNILVQRKTLRWFCGWVFISLACSLVQCLGHITGATGGTKWGFGRKWDPRNIRGRSPWSPCQLMNQQWPKNKK